MVSHDSASVQGNAGAWPQRARDAKRLCESERWWAAGRAADPICSPSLWQQEMTGEAYKPATCHYRANRSFPTNKIHNYTSHITLISPTEVIGNP